MSKEYVGMQVNDYLLKFRDGFQIRLDKIREDKVIRSKDSIYIILSNATISDGYASEIMTSKSRMIDEILSHSSVAEIMSNNKDTMITKYTKCELLTFSIVNRCGDCSEYRMVIKLNKNNMNVEFK